MLLDLHKEPEPVGANWFWLIVKELPGGGRDPTRVEPRSGTLRGQEGGIVRGWNPQKWNSQGAGR